MDIEEDEVLHATNIENAGKIKVGKRGQRGSQPDKAPKKDEEQDEPENVSRSNDG